MITNEFDELAEQQVHDTHYLKSVTDLGDTCSITANRDIHSSTGLKLAMAGMHINSALYERLMHHKLAPPLDQCLSVENAVTGESLAERAAQMLRENPRLNLVEATQFNGWSLPFAIKQVQLNPAVAFKLTVMRETNPKLFLHSIYVAIVCTYVGMQLKLDKWQLVQLSTAALLHDIGILHVDPALLSYDHVMAGEERRHLYAHPITAGMILANYPEYSAEMLNGVLQHHERLDGSGYPRGLKGGDEIGLIGQIIAVSEIVASQNNKMDDESGWARLETILKLNQRRYGWDIIRHFTVFYRGQERASKCSESDKKESREKLDRIIAIFTSWGEVLKICNEAAPACSFINKRMENLGVELIAAGLNPYAEDGNYLGVMENPQACYDMRLLIDETLWQFHSITQEASRRWPSVESDTSGELAAASKWMAEVEKLLHGLPGKPGRGEQPLETAPA